MDFQTAPEIREAVLNRAKHGIFGYTVIPVVWYAAYQGWWEKQHPIVNNGRNDDSL